MKKWIPEGGYCTHCKFRKYITTIERNKSNCEHANDCDEVCWSKLDNSCYSVVYKCEYLNYVDWTQESLLWDGCKECGVKDY